MDIAKRSDKYGSSGGGGGWQIAPCFSITLHIKDLAILERIQAFFGVGHISITKKSCLYRVRSLSQLTEVIVPFFDKFPLITAKLTDFLLFKGAVDLIVKKEHLTEEGINKLMSIRVSMNKGAVLFNDGGLLRDFPNLEVIPRPVITTSLSVPHPMLMVGFISGDGSFMINIGKSNNTKSGVWVGLCFLVSQNIRDELLLKSFIEYFGCGNLHINLKDSTCNYRCTDFNEIVNNIIPFFKSNPIFGVKLQDFEDFCLASELIINKAHLTKEGLEKIRLIKSSMNSSRLDSTYKQSSENQLGIVPLRGKVVNSSFTNFSIFNGLSNNGIILKSQAKNITGFIIDKGLQCKVGKFYTNGEPACFFYTELFVLFRNSYIIDNLNNSFQNLVKDKGLSLEQEKDIFTLLCNKQLPNKDILLNEHPDLLDVQIFLNDEFNKRSSGIGLITIYEKQIYTSIDSISSLIRKYNSSGGGSLIMAEKSYFLSEF